MRAGCAKGRPRQGQAEPRAGREQAEIKLKRYGEDVESEAKQMRNRNTYLRLSLTTLEEKRLEVL